NIKRNFGMPHPEGYRKAVRHMRQAEKFNRPIVTFIDTKGAEPGKAAEERGQSEAIADSLKVMAGLKVPLISIVIREGGRCGAIVTGVGNPVTVLEITKFSVISPGGAAALLWKDSGLARQAAESMQITAPDLKQLGVIDEIIPEPKGGAHRDISLKADRICEALRTSLQTLRPLYKYTLLENRCE